MKKKFCSSECLSLTSFGITGSGMWEHGFLAIFQNCFKNIPAGYSLMVDFLPNMHKALGLTIKIYPCFPFVVV